MSEPFLTFPMVAPLENSQTSGSQATQHKLNSIAHSAADLTEHVADRDDDGLGCDFEELRYAVGLETRESTTRNVRVRTERGS